MNGARVASPEVAGSPAVSGDLKRLALRGLIWSVVQSWGGKALTFVLFLVLARLLTPAQLGAAAAVMVVIAFLQILGEQGYGDALVQRRDLQPHEANLPFVVSIVSACMLAALLALGSPWIARAMRAEHLAPYLAVAALGLPLTSLWMFQEAFYRRGLQYRYLAARLLFVTALAGALAIALAFAGWGTWSLVVQALLASGLSAAWMWSRPLWKPSRQFDRTSFREIFAFSRNVATYRVADFVSARAVELIIVTLHGAAALGLYSVGSRIYQTLIQLLSSSVMNVSLSALSRIAHDVDRVRAAYTKTVTIGSAIGTAVFVGVGAVAPELTRTIFGERWADSAPVMQVLMLLGAVQCVQFMNGSVFNALGRPQYIARMTIAKATVTLAALALVPAGSAYELAVVFAVCQLSITPVTYALVLRLLHMPLRSLLRHSAPFFFSAAVAFAAVQWLRSAALLPPSPVLQLCLLSGSYVVVYGAMAALTGWGQLRAVAAYLAR